MDTGDIVRLDSHTHGGAGGNVIDDCATEITRGKIGLGHTHTSLSVVDTHTNFRLHNLGEDESECLLEGI